VTVFALDRDWYEDEVISSIEAFVRAAEDGREGGSFEVVAREARELILPDERLWFAEEEDEDEGGNMLLCDPEVEAGLRTSAIDESSSARIGVEEYRPLLTISASSALLFLVPKLRLEVVLRTEFPLPSPIGPEEDNPNFSSNISFRSDVLKIVRSSRLRNGSEVVSIELMAL